MTVVSALLSSYLGVDYACRNTADGADPASREPAP